MITTQKVWRFTNTRGTHYKEYTIRVSMDAPFTVETSYGRIGGHQTVSTATFPSAWQQADFVDRTVRTRIKNGYTLESDMMELVGDISADFADDLADMARVDGTG